MTQTYVLYKYIYEYITLNKYVEIHSYINHFDVAATVSIKIKY